MDKDFIKDMFDITEECLIFNNQDLKENHEQRKVLVEVLNEREKSNPIIDGMVGLNALVRCAIKEYFFESIPIFIAYQTLSGSPRDKVMEELLLSFARIEEKFRHSNEEYLELSKKLNIKVEEFQKSLNSYENKIFIKIEELENEIAEKGIRSTVETAFIVSRFLEDVESRNLIGL